MVNRRPERLDPIETMRVFAENYQADRFNSPEEYNAAVLTLCEVMGLQPYLHSDGTMGVHLMEMSASFDTSETTLTLEIADSIERCVECDEPEDLLVLRDLLAENLRAVEDAVEELMLRADV
jgi:hypothetical protein